MAVYKKRTCCVCGAVYQEAKEKKTPDPCQKCGGLTAYSSKWYFCIYVFNQDGKRVQIRRAASKYKDEAKAAEAKALEERSGGCPVSLSKVTFSHAAKEFGRWMDVRVSESKLAPATAKFYRMRLDVHLLPFFGGYKLGQIDHAAISRYIKQRKEVVIYTYEDGTVRYPAHSDINRDIATLKRVFSVSVYSGLIKHNTVEGFEMLPEDGERERFLSEEEMDRLLMEASKPKYPDHLYPIIMVALNTGLRRAGVLTLRWEEINWRLNEIVKVVKHHRAKGATQVRIPMTSDLLEVLQKWRVRGGVHRVSGYVFPSPTSLESSLLTSSKFGFEKAVKAAGIKDFRFHDMRRTFATYFLEQFPEHIEVLRVLMGHSGQYMTRLYARITDRSKQKLMGELKVTKGVRSDYGSD